MSRDPALPLHEVLRRCHRDELMPLAKVLKVNPIGLGRDRLAQVLEHAMRAAGANEMENLLLRKGQGPDYPRVLAALAERQGVATQFTVERTERAVLRHWQHAGQPDQEHGESLALVLGSSSTALQPHERARKRGGLDHLWAVAVTVLRLLAPLVGPLAAIGFLLWLGRPRDELLLPAVMHLNLLRTKVAKRFTVGIVGPPSSGKDAAMAAVFDVQTGGVHPVAGSTKEVAVFLIDDEGSLQVVNTPGVGDVLQELTEEARAVLDQIDLFLFLVNAQGGVRTREKTEWQLCRARRRPMLVVVNKIDTLRPDDRERFVEDTRKKLGMRPGTVLGAAFDPLPQLSPEPLGVEPIRAWMREQLEEAGRDAGLIPG